MADLDSLQLWTSVVASLASAAVYAYLGRFLLERRLRGAPRVALAMFSTWWLALALTVVLGAIETILVYVGLDVAVIGPAFAYVALLPFMVAVASLAYYLAFLYTGRPVLLWLILGFYAFLYALLVYAVAWMHPIGVEIVAGAANTAYVRMLDGPLGWVLGILLVGPIFAAAIAYGLLFFRVDGRTEKYRIALVSLSFLVWFGVPFVAAALGFGRSVTGLVVNRVLAIVAPLVILAAYRPPASIRRRLGVRGFDDVPSPYAHGPARARPRREV